MRKRLHRVLRWWRVGVPVALAALIYFGWPGSWTYTVSPETTYITAPLDEEGYPDYSTALNQRLAEGVTPENNACVLIWQALGPHPERGSVPADHFRWLQIERPPEGGDYFVSWEEFHDRKVNATLPLREKKRTTGIDEAEQQWLDRLEHSTRLSWPADADPDLAEWLRINDRPLALAIEASKRSRYYSPLIANAKVARIMNGLLPTVQKTGDLGKALASRAMLRVAAGQSDLAWQDLMACQRLGRLLTNGGTAIEQLFGFRTAAMGSDAQVVLLSHPQTLLQIRSELDDLRRLPPFGKVADQFDLGDRFMCLDALLTAARYGPEYLDAPGVKTPQRKPFYERLFTPGIDYDPAFRNANAIYDRLVAASRLPDRASRMAELAKVRSEVDFMKAQAQNIGKNGPSIPSKSRRGELIGNLLISVMLVTWDLIHEVADRAEQSNRHLLVAAGLAAYRVETGRYPAGLAELAPKYLPAVPGDLFSGQSLIYRPTEAGYLFYSVGVNGLDEGGGADDEPRGDDLRVRMPVKEPAAK
jgi:hypothetical protein